jgi:hypothetical protein
MSSPVSVFLAILNATTGDFSRVGYEYNCGAEGALDTAVTYLTAVL